MEFAEVVRRRRMVRTFADRPVERAVLDGVLDAGRRAPSAGSSRGSAFVALEGSAQTEPFWSLTAPDPPRPTTPRWDHLRLAPVIVVPLASRQAYLDRYAEPDKAGLGRDRPEGWPVPYWLIDTAFATMAVLLAATDAGLGAAFFALGGGEAALLAHLGVPPTYEPIGAIALGWPDPGEQPRRHRRKRFEIVHYGHWT